MTLVSMPSVVAIGAASLVIGCGNAFAESAASNRPDGLRRPVATYSIVARDPATGEIGVAVQSHWFSVGSVVPWVQAGIDAVATQSLAMGGKVEDALPLFRKVFEREPIWVELVPRIAKAGLLPENKAALERILPQAKRSR